MVFGTLFQKVLGFCNQNAVSSGESLEDEGDEGTVEWRSTYAVSEGNKISLKS